MFLGIHPPIPPQTTDSATPGSGDILPQGVRLIRASTHLNLAFARRLVSPANSDIDQAAKRLIASAAKHGIDLQLAWATAMGPHDAPIVRQACLPILGAGRTAMVYLSDPPRSGDMGGSASGRIERVAVLRAMCGMLEREFGSGVALAQALPDPQEFWAIEALEGAGFTNVGQLSYMRRALQSDDLHIGGEAVHRSDECRLPEPFRLASLTEFHSSKHDELLIRAMDASYEETLDCPELCGLRSTQDILASHKATGVFNPSLWWVVMQEDHPVGCLMLSACPEQRTFELVYIGLGRVARGKGLGRALMEFAVRQCARRERSWTMSCAVDRRNAPALRLYDSLGFRAFARRAPYVRAIRHQAGNKSAS